MVNRPEKSENLNAVSEFGKFRSKTEIVLILNMSAWLCMVFDDVSEDEKIYALLWKTRKIENFKWNIQKI